MKPLKYYVLACLLCPLFNIEPTEQPTESITKEVAFWCDCGVKMRWDEKILKRI